MQALIATILALVGALLVGNWLWRRLAPGPPSRTVRLFLSAERSSRAVRDALVVALGEDIDSGRIVVHHDREVRRGGGWDRALHPRIHDADLYVLLVTPGWCTDPLIRGGELPVIRARLARGRARGVVVLVDAARLDDADLLALPLTPPDGRPLRRRGAPLDLGPVRQSLHAAVEQLRQSS
jgi:hypothetical protein